MIRCSKRTSFIFLSVFILFFGLIQRPRPETHLQRRRWEEVGGGCGGEIQLHFKSESQTSRLLAANWISDVRKIPAELFSHQCLWCLPLDWARSPPLWHTHTHTQSNSCSPNRGVTQLWGNGHSHASLAPASLADEEKCLRHRDEATGAAAAEI